MMEIVIEFIRAIALVVFLCFCVFVVPEIPYWTERKWNCWRHCGEGSDRHSWWCGCMYE